MRPAGEVQARLLFSEIGTSTSEWTQARPVGEVYASGYLPAIFAKFAIQRIWQISRLDEIKLSPDGVGHRGHRDLADG
jgi:hypothetical protein